MALTWDVFCRVVDNFGDVGVCWRLARQLAQRGHRARLWIDDARALAWMAPHGASGVEVGPFEGAGDAGDVVVEAFGCDPPAPFVERMAARAPVWLNLEYLSAEAWVERSHGLPSPQRNGLTKWFFFPGFTPAAGGLLREPGLLQRQAAFDRGAWLTRQGVDCRPGERVVSLFCYPQAPLGLMLQSLARQGPALLLLTPAIGEPLPPLPPGLRSHRLPWLPQDEYDHLLWAGDLNFVRGEDSLVRSLWAGAPFVWHIYPQDDGVHAGKLQALVQRMPAVNGLLALWQAWNGLAPAEFDWPDSAGWRVATQAFRRELAAQDDLVTQLERFVQPRLRAAC